MLKNMCIGFDVCARLGEKSTAAFYHLSEMRCVYPPPYTIFCIFMGWALTAPTKLVRFIGVLHTWNKLAHYRNLIPVLKDFTAAQDTHQQLIQGHFAVKRLKAQRRDYAQGAGLRTQIQAVTRGAALITQVTFLRLISCLSRRVRYQEDIILKPPLKYMP